MTRVKGVPEGADRRNIKYLHDIREIANSIEMAGRELMQCEVIETALEELINNPTKYRNRNKMIKWAEVRQVFVDAYWDWVK